jgi:hypothetical protein
LTIESILWRGSYLNGYEACRLFTVKSSWHLTGTAVFSYSQQPCRLDYLVVCDSGWNTLSGKVTGWLDSTNVDIELAVDAHHQWWYNGLECPEVAGCLDLDLNFSPSTNLLPIRRLNLAIGQAAQVKAAWLRFPGFKLEPLRQLYRRIDQSTYRYESAGGGFAADLQVNQAGFVTNYPGIWEAVVT